MFLFGRLKFMRQLFRLNRRENRTASWTESCLKFISDASLFQADSGEKSFSKKKCEKRAGAGERQGAATAPFPKSRASYFRFARFNMSPLYYLRAWHRLIRRENLEDVFELALKEKTGTSKLATVSG